MMVVGVFCCVFFFKQKTAYEMRISDWSSDVCSSDLVEPAFEQFGRDPVLVLHMRRDGLTLVATAPKHHRRPERRQLFQMFGPVINGVVEDRTQFGVGWDTCVKRIHQPGQSCFVTQLLSVYGSHLNHALPIHLYLLF